MDFYLTTSASAFPCCQINWLYFLYHSLDAHIYCIDDYRQCQPSLNKQNNSKVEQVARFFL